MHSPSPTHPTVSVMLTPDEAAKHLGVKVSTLSSWRYTGVGPAYYRVGNGRGSNVRYYLDDLDDWLRARRVEPEAVTESAAAVRTA
ncbi:helix-turn-helix domain-containing protein [Actinomyces faecalis]|uniref:helix-turn-helix domain-containing protein n=1 Tax=Actinomyces faecalis TaxID=2722820 RepID=UPI0015524150|nr:helix-turn-helix domain-containing protein [Actinomyces faecalis]